MRLTVGAANQTVEVNATGLDLQRDDASIGMLVTSDVIEQTPLYLRNWDDLLRVVPGVQIARYTNQSGATSAGRTGDFNVNGVHSLQNNFILDGIDNNTFSENVQELSTEASHPSVDVIAQFNVITSPYSAEYGRSPGGVVSVNTRSGTNNIHGAAYYYVRNQFFDSFDYFTKQTTNVKPEKQSKSIWGQLRRAHQEGSRFWIFQLRRNEDQAGSVAHLDRSSGQRARRRFQHDCSCECRRGSVRHRLQSFPPAPPRTPQPTVSRW